MFPCIDNVARYVHCIEMQVKLLFDTDYEGGSQPVVSDTSALRTSFSHRDHLPSFATAVSAEPKISE